MKSKSVFLGFLLVAALAVPAASQEIIDVACRDFYNFGGLVFTDLHTSRISYSPGEEVSVSYSLINAFQSPLPEGAIRAIVLYRGAEDVDRTENDDIVDVFYPLTGAGVQAGANHSGAFSWRVPENAVQGVYVINLYFSVDKRYNIAGVPFLTSYPAKSTSFSVSSDAPAVFLLNKSETYLNYVRYMFRAPIPKVEQGSAASLRTLLEIPSGLDASVEYRLFSWDDTGKELPEYAKTEKVSGSKALDYSVSGISPGVYMMVVTASSKERKSILQARFYVGGERPIINWAGLSYFPLITGKPVNVTFCVSNSASSPVGQSGRYAVKGRASLLDASGKELAASDFSSEVSSQLSGKQFVFVPRENATKLWLNTELYGKSGEVLDGSRILYDYERFLGRQLLMRILDINVSGSRLAYSIMCSDEYGIPLSGHAVIYMLSSGGSVLRLDEKDVNGSYDGSFDLFGIKRGIYTLKVLETGRETSHSRDFQYYPETAGSDTGASSEDGPPGSDLTLPHGEDSVGGGSGNPIYLGFAAVAIIAVFYLVGKKNQHKKNESE